ncbi:hypothetical protein RSOL_490710 [Rhizoctonia solani AG-3 Rhs1AP]|uniref:Uncharacterized protein n=2 Tax=Rhizoctonia solani AG-3 TaxID=1086053 RepID=A0A074SWQ5_9AGAM|nr:hypothetical protein RSOL_490710 [Rhizoctonia solani AG-3 Rhs1AP]KEP54287.1 hypothetical protein V565_019190 [Rhizoctonia solani 123E]
MISNDLLVSITNPQGEPLQEYKQARTGDNSVECWVPSDEGSGFQIHFQAIRNFKPKLGLHCSIRLDGKTVSSGGLKSSSISRGLTGIKTGMTVAKGIKRHYVFGRHNVTGMFCIRVYPLLANCINRPRRPCFARRPKARTNGYYPSYPVMGQVRQVTSSK